MFAKPIVVGGLGVVLGCVGDGMDRIDHMKVDKINDGDEEEDVSDLI